MAFLAGMRLTAARLYRSKGRTTLTDTALGTTLTFGQWGTETIVFPNPGIAVEVDASLSGRLYNQVDANVYGSSRVGISLDGGATFTYGPAPYVSVGTSVGIRSYFGGLHSVSGVPSGDIVVKAEFNTSDTSTQALDGFMMADIEANP